VGFHEVQFPPDISYGSSVGPGYKTSIVTLQSGAEERIQHLSTPKHRYVLTLKGRAFKAHLAATKTFYIARGGCANGFRIKDWLDFTSNADGATAQTATDQATSPAVGDGSNKLFQLVKRYVSGSQTVVRTIEKPVSGTVKVSVDNVEQTSPGWSFPWSVDTTTGVVTFSTAPTSSKVVRAGFEFDVPVRFAEEVDEFLEISLESFQRGTLSFPLVELFNESTAEDDYPYGGASSVGAQSSVSISKATGRVVTFTSTGASSTCTLPPKADVALGGPHWLLFNAGSNDLPIIDVDDASTVVTLDPTGGTQPTCELWLGYTTAGARKWYALG